MLRVPHLVVCALTLCLVFASTTQDPGHAPMPGSVTKTYDVGGVNRLEFTIRFTDTGGEGLVAGGEMFCTNYCNGRKHYLHDTCDASCDSACTAIHQMDLDPTWEYRDVALQRYDHNPMADIARAGERFGATTPPRDVDHTISTDVKGLFQDAQGNSKYRVKVKCRHFNDKPCSRTTRRFMGRIYDVSIAWKYYRDTEVDGKTIRTSGPSGTTPFARLVIPLDKFVDHHRVDCRCSIVGESGQTGFIPGGTSTSTGTTTGTTTGDSTGGSTGGTTGTTGGNTGGATGGGTTGGTTGGTIEEVPGGGVRLGEDPFGPLLGDKNLEKIQFGVVCDGMFSGEVFATNPFIMPMSINLAPGTCLDTDDDGVQDEVILVRTVLNLPLIGQSPDGRADAVRAKLRLACLEMNKREPSPNVKYRVLPARDPVLSRLAAITDQARIRGPWDQARIWIYTDAATHEEIKKKMIPSPGANSYLRVMHECAQAGVPIAQKRYEKCFSASLLSALDSQPEHLGWFAVEVAKRDAGGLATWAKGEASRYATALGASADKRDFESTAALISALCGSGIRPAQQAGLVLLKGVPDSSRSLLMAHDLSPAWALCWSSDGEVAKEATSMLNAYAPAGKDFYLANMKR